MSLRYFVMFIITILLIEISTYCVIAELHEQPTSNDKISVPMIDKLTGSELAIYTNVNYAIINDVTERILYWQPQVYILKNKYFIMQFSIILQVNMIQIT